MVCQYHFLTMPETPDADTQKILDDMKKDGLEIPGANAGEAEAKAKAEAEEKAQSEAKAKEEADKKAKEEAEAKAKAEAEAGSKSDEDEDDDEKEGRKVLFIPVGQVKAEKKALENKLKGEFQTQIDGLKTTITDLTTKLGSGVKTTGEKTEIKQEITDEVKKVAEKWGVEPEMVLEIIALAKPAESKPTDSMTEEDKETLRKSRERDETEHQTNLFNTEFVGSDEKPGVANNEEIKKLVEDRGYTLEQAKAKLYDFVFSTAGEAYAKIPLSEILQMKLSTLLPQKKKSAESGRGGTGSGADGKSDKKGIPTKEEMDAMSDEEFLKQSNELGKGSGMEIRRVGSGSK